MRNSFLVFLVILISVALNLGTIRQDEDPIKKTQTDPILYKKKQEELKDGEKGAPLVSFVYYFRRLFRLDPPVEEAERGKIKESYHAIPEPGDPIPEDLSDLSEEDKPVSWWEEVPDDELPQESSGK